MERRHSLALDDLDLVRLRSSIARNRDNPVVQCRNIALKSEQSLFVSWGCISRQLVDCAHLRHAQSHPSNETTFLPCPTLARLGVGADADKDITRLHIRALISFSREDNLISFRSACGNVHRQRVVALYNTVSIALVAELRNLLTLAGAVRAAVFCQLELAHDRSVVSRPLESSAPDLLHLDVREHAREDLVLLDDNTLAVTCSTLGDVLRRVGTATGAVRAHNLAGDVELDGAAVVHVGETDLEVGDDRRRPRRLLTATAEELRERIRGVLLLLVTLNRLLASSVVDSSQLWVSLVLKALPAGIVQDVKGVTNLVIGENLVRCSLANAASP